MCMAVKKPDALFISDIKKVDVILMAVKEADA